MAERHTIETYGRAPHNRNIWSTATERHTIETYGRAPHNRNIWSTATERHTIETYGRPPHNRNIWSTATARHTIDYVTPGRFFCLLQLPPLYHYSPLVVGPLLSAFNSY